MNLGLAALLAASTANILPAQAAVILGLYNTGVQNGGDEWGAGGGAKPGNGADLHWDNSGGLGGHAFTGSPIYSNWIANDDTSQWLTPRPQGNADFDPDEDGLYSYTLDFDLTGFDLTTANFTGRFAADNRVTSILLNGQEITGSGGTYDSWTDFASVSDAFVEGVNTLSFNVTNFAQASGNPTGLRVEFLTNSVSPGANTPVPEPATWAMMLVGFGVVGASMRRRPQKRMQMS
ncbi:hypothetical protein ACFB49_15220 [Sphingomonas sp. DBB INV C78]